MPAMSRRKQNKNRNRLSANGMSGDGDTKSSSSRNDDDGKRTKGRSSSSSSSSSTSTPTSKTSPVVTMTPANGRFFTSHDKDVQIYIQRHYSKFVHLPRQRLSPSDFHERAKAALERLRDMNYYQYDVVTAGGKHSSRTFVKRCLVGDSGITYKYLGLRLFAHSWDRGPKSIPALQAIGDLNKMMIDMTRNQAAAEAAKKSA